MNMFENDSGRPDIGRPNIGSRGHVSEKKNEDGLYDIYGIAIGNNDITRGHLSGEKKLWKPSVIEEAASTLEGKQFVVNHANKDSYKVVGEVTDVKYDSGVGLKYRGVIDDDELAKKIDHGWLEVSPRIIHSKEGEEVKGVKIPDSIREYDNLSIVPNGAAGSNEVNLGTVEELSVADIQQSFDDTIEVDIERPFEIDELQDGEMDYSRWMFDNPEGAQGAAQKFDCGNTYHEHNVNGQTWYMPCENHNQFLEKLKEQKTDEMALSEARTPEYDETEETSWGDVSKDLTDWVDALGYDDVESVDDLTDSQREEVAKHTLLGDVEGETWEDVRYFPVVNPNTGDLNRGALEAVRGGRGQSADISENTWESAASIAGTLLEDEFGADVPDVEELSQHADEMSYSKEEMRIASQLASYSSLTKDECLSMIDVLNPNKETNIEKMASLIKSTMEDDELDEFLSMFEEDEEDESAEESNSILNTVFR